MKPELTIIIPCYNCEKTLEEAVESCFNQDLKSFEIIMVDDGSTDTTRDVMRHIAGRHNEIKLFYHDKNMGGGATRNTAVANSCADVIFCLDSDDLLPPRTLNTMLNFLHEKKCDGVTFHKSIKFNGKNIHDVNYIDISPYIETKIPFKSLLLHNKFCPVYVNFMYTKNVFNKIEGYPTSHGYDTQGFAWRFMCAGLTAYTCPDATYLHRVNFKESYYIREDMSGKSNFNLREIFLENYYVFSKDTLDFIINFNCSDFTKNILNELTLMNNVFIPNYQSVLGKIHPKIVFKLPEIKSVHKKSLYGYLLRIARKIKNTLKRIYNKYN